MWYMAICVLKVKHNDLINQPKLKFLKYILKPMRDICKGGRYHWSPEVNIAFAKESYQMVLFDR